MLTLPGSMGNKPRKDSALSARCSSRTDNSENFVSNRRMLPFSTSIANTIAVNDGLILLRDIAGDAAQKVANQVNPSEDQLRQIDEPAGDNTWHDVPDMSAGNIKSQIKSTYDRQKPFSSGDLKEASGNASQAAHPSGARDPADAAGLAAQDQRYGTDAGVDAQAGYENAASTLRQRASENIPEETKDRARERRETTKNYLKDKMPEERRDQVTYRMKKLLVECQGHPDYQRAITTLLDLAEEYSGHLNHIGQQSTGAVRGAHADNSLKTAEKDLKVCTISCRCRCIC